MAKIQLFEATKDSVIVRDEDGYIVVVRNGITSGQAKEMAEKMNHYAQDTKEKFKPTQREQKFNIHAEVDFEFTTEDGAAEYDTLYTVKEVTTEVKEYLQEFDRLNGEYNPKAKVTVTLVHDKQVPNK